MLSEEEPFYARDDFTRWILHVSELMRYDNLPFPTSIQGARPAPAASLSFNPWNENVQQSFTELLTTGGLDQQPEYEPNTGVSTVLNLGTGTLQSDQDMSPPSLTNAYSFFGGFTPPPPPAPVTTPKPDGGESSFQLFGKTINMEEQNVEES